MNCQKYFQDTQKTNWMFLEPKGSKNFKTVQKLSDNLKLEITCIFLLKITFTCNFHGFRWKTLNLLLEHLVSMYIFLLTLV